MKKYFFAKYLLIALIAGGLALEPMLYCSSESEEQEVHEMVNSLNEESEKQEVPAQKEGPKKHQDQILNFLKGITALKHILAQANNDKNKEYLLGGFFLDLKVNSENGQELLDAAIVRAIKKISEYEKFLVQLTKEIESSTPENEVVVPSLEKTLKDLWFASTVHDHDILASLLKKVASGFALTSIPTFVMLLGLQAAIQVYQQKDKEEFANKSLSISFAMGLLGAAVGYSSSDSIANGESHQLENLTVLNELLDMVKTTEELFNGALVAQKRRELLNKKRIVGGAELIADY